MNTMYALLLLGLLLVDPGHAATTLNQVNPNENPEIQNAARMDWGEGAPVGCAGEVR